MNMKKIRVAIVGYGNIGKSVLEALQASSDFEVVGIVRRSTSLDNQPAELSGIHFTDDISRLKNVHVAIVCSPSRIIPEQVKSLLALGIHTVDSFDIHADIWDYKVSIDPVSKKHDSVAIISSGWDPGSNSIIRSLFEAMAPKGMTYTNFGPGMSMGHTVAAKAIKGVKNALSITVPKGSGIHQRKVYIELEEGFVFKEVEDAIKRDAYFAKDETLVTLVNDVDSLINSNHAAHIERDGVSGATPFQQMEFKMSINNPALTAQLMVSAARATVRLQPGAYTLIEVPIIDMLSGSKEELIKRLV